jgi:DNA-directed RNA polymerase subunit L
LLSKTQFPMSLTSHLHTTILHTTHVLASTINLYIRTHDVFHVSMLRKYIANLDVIVEYEPLVIQEGLTYVEELVKIVDKKEQVLCTKTIPIVKVLSRNHGVEEASWDAEHDMWSRYLHLFE